LASVPANGEGLDDRMKNVVTGVQATERELLAVFERNGIRKVVAQDAPFDPQFHQAVSEVQDPTRPANSVAQVFMDGYTLNGRLMRAAMVVVAKGGPAMARPPVEAANDAVDADGA
jgi:molecular chaperone GrpE